MLDWLLSPIDALRAHDVGTAISWHGRAMVLGWGILAPVGVLVARYLKVLPNQNWPAQADNQFWWIFHRCAQYSAVILTLIGVAIVWASDGSTSATSSAWLHRLLGWMITGFGVAQILSGWLRGSKGGPTDDAGLRGDHYDMTARRVMFERFHKVLGYSILSIAAVTILTGMWHANAPTWMWLCVTGAWVGFGIFAVLLQRRGMAMGSYQAIWGPDQAHPGNKTQSTAKEQLQAGE